jgi:hypothetical protein
MTEKLGTSNSIERIARGMLLLLLMVVSAIFVFHQQGVNDPDIWWHLRTGEWIAHHQTIPQVDPFSNIGRVPWAAYSWAFELVMYFLYTHWHLLGILTYTSLMVVLITAAIYHLTSCLQPDFTKAILLTLAAVMGMSRLYTPRPWLLTVLFFVIELDILFGEYAANKSSRSKREIILLPIIFMLWANVHIQFINGLIVLLWGAIAPLLSNVASKILNLPITESQLQQKTKRRFAIFGLCIAATFCNPYGWKLYLAAWQLATQAGVLNKISELQALPFRDSNDYLILFLALGSAIVFAWKRHSDLFEGGLLGLSIMISFRCQRDVWMVVIVGVAILAKVLGNLDEQQLDGAEGKLISRIPLPLLTFVAVLVVLSAGKFLRIDNKKLETVLDTSMPVKAINFVKEKGYAGPLYNTYDWGGILIWDLRLPVSMDGRAALYGDQRIDRSIATWDGQPDWEKNPELIRSNLVIAPVNKPLTQLLSLSPDFHVAYKDKVAAVFVRNLEVRSASGSGVLAMKSASH